MDLLRDLARREGITILAVLHDHRRSPGHFVQRLMLLDRGRLVADGTARRGAHAGHAFERLRRRSGPRHGRRPWRGRQRRVEVELVPGLSRRRGTSPGPRQVGSADEASESISGRTSTVAGWFTKSMADGVIGGSGRRARGATPSLMSADGPGIIGLWMPAAFTSARRRCASAGSRDHRSRIPGRAQPVRPLRRQPSCATSSMNTGASSWRPRLGIGTNGKSPCETRGMRLSDTSPARRSTLD